MARAQRFALDRRAAAPPPLFRIGGVVHGHAAFSGHVGGDALHRGLVGLEIERFRVEVAEREHLDVVVVIDRRRVVHLVENGERVGRAPRRLQLRRAGAVEEMLHRHGRRGLRVDGGGDGAAQALHEKLDAVFQARELLVDDHVRIEAKAQRGLGGIGTKLERVVARELAALVVELVAILVNLDEDVLVREHHGKIGEGRFGAHRRFGALGGAEAAVDALRAKMKC